MSSDQKRSTLKADSAVDRAEVKLPRLKLLYRGYATVNVLGPVSGQLYRFSRQKPVNTIDERDAAPILQTRLFRRTR
jgi:hypothetical protein